jgi:hypothetical protein
MRNETNIKTKILSKKAAKYIRILYFSTRALLRNSAKVVHGHVLVGLVTGGGNNKS